MTNDEAMNVLSGGVAPFPHCDQYVLHEPGTCDTCDYYPAYQALRIMWGIDFTNQPRAGVMDSLAECRLPCPATLRRDAETIHKWRGNRPQSRWVSAYWQRREGE